MSNDDDVDSRLYYSFVAEKIRLLYYSTHTIVNVEQRYPAVVLQRTVRRKIRRDTNFYKKFAHGKEK